MFNKKKMYLFFAMLAMLIISACNESTVDYVVIKNVGVKNLISINETTFSSGQPSQKQLDKLAKAGVKHIINLRLKNELSFDEADFSHQSGLKYHAIPINGAEGITKENAQLLDDKLATLKGKPTLVHCGSGNRVGALVALHAGLNGESIEQAVAKGKQWGLTGLEAVVRAKLAK